MKIKGPGGPTGPQDIGPEGPGEVKAGATDFAQKLDGPKEADPVARIAEELRSGAITAEQAVTRLVDAALGGGPAAQLPPGLAQKLRAQVDALLADDPYLQELQGRIGAK